jgi:hypothetical protein
MKRVLILLFLVLFVSSCSQFDDDENIFGSNVTNNGDNETNGSIFNNTINQTSNETSNNTNNQTDETNDHGPQTCLDTDGGLEYEERGTVIVSNGQFRQVADRCEDTGQLVEYYCNGVELGIQPYYCIELGAYICMNGACVGVNATNTTNTTDNETNGTNST